MRGMCLALLLLAAPAQGETIVAGLSQNLVSINANFVGSEILVYGAVKRDAPEPEGQPLEVIITVEGPHIPLTIRRKERVVGVWVNNAAITVDSAPVFYAVATTGPLDRVLSATEDLRHSISLDQVIRAVGVTSEAENPGDFIEALKRLELTEGAWRVDEGQVSFTERTLFRTDVMLPANLTEGDYRVRIFLTRGGAVVDQHERLIGVRKAGLERFLFNMAQQQPFFYGLASLALAVVAGWGASAGFRFIRR